MPCLQRPICLACGCASLKTACPCGLQGSRFLGARRSSWASCVSPIYRTAVREIRDARSGSDALGDKRFQARIETALGRRVTRGTPGRPIATRNAVPEQQSDLF